VLDGKPTVSTEGIREVAALVLRHRVLPNYTASGEGIDSARIIEHVIEAFNEPVYTE